MGGERERREGLAYTMPATWVALFERMFANAGTLFGKVQYLSLQLAGEEHSQP